MAPPGTLSPGAALGKDLGRLRQQERLRIAGPAQETSCRRAPAGPLRRRRLLPRASVSSSSTPAPAAVSSPAPLAPAPEAAPAEGGGGVPAPAAGSPPVVDVVEEVAVQAGAPFRVVTLASSESKVDYLGESTKGDMKLKRNAEGGPAAPPRPGGLGGLGPEEEGASPPAAASSVVPPAPEGAPPAPPSSAAGGGSFPRAEVPASASMRARAPSPAQAPSTASEPGQGPPLGARPAAARAWAPADDGYGVAAEESAGLWGVAPGPSGRPLARELVGAQEAEQLLDQLGIPPMFPQGLPSRGIFCSRTLNLRSITTIGYDMDYTLIHYNVTAWEGRAYEYAKENLRSKGYPVEGLKFDPGLVIRGLVIDKRNGNIVKADRFGYVKRASHGTTMLSQKAISELYGRELVDLRNESAFEFLNTLFSVSEAVIYMQMVDRLDAGLLPLEIAPGDYGGLYQVVSKALFRAHVEGQLKAEIINEPERFVELDPELPLALLDQKEAGKRLLLITNSDYTYTNRMMTHSFDRFLPEGTTWRNLFDMVIVSAMKPDFFSMAHPLYEIVTPDGLMRPCFKASTGGLYCGGSAQMVERALGFEGDETLYVGDHIYTDVSQSKLHLRWRTCLICRELEREVEAQAEGQEQRQRLEALMEEKERVGDCFNQLRLAFQRRAADRAPQTAAVGQLEDAELLGAMKKLLKTMERLDQEIAPLLEADGSFFNARWGYLSRAGLWDKSHLTRQIEKYADIYTSRVSNFLRYTPFVYFRSQRQLIAHDMHSSWPHPASEEE